MTDGRAGSTVAVTGWGAVTPLGVGVDALLEGSYSGRVGPRDGFGTCDEFHPSELFSRREARNTDRAGLLALAATDEAVETAGWKAGRRWKPDRIACVMATNFGGLESLEGSLAAYRDRGRRAVSPRGFTKSMQGSLASTLTIKHGWRGESMTLGAGCAGGLQAVGLGARLIGLDLADAAVVGGSDAFMTSWAKDTFEVMGALSPTRQCRPFDRRHDGMVPSEGAAVVILERWEGDAAERPTPRALLDGFAATSDAHDAILPDPNGCELARALAEALQRSRLGPEAIDYINPHGAGTPIGDRVEAEAISAVFGDEAARVPVSSTKSAIGHLMGAAGTAELIATAAAIDRRQAAPNLGLEDVADGLDLAFIKGTPAPLRDRGGKGFLAALTLSFGLGGQNAAAVVCTPDRYLGG